ncbi:MAG: carbohydrate ABC transporter permease [Eubacteriales bacterium]
MKQKLKSKVLCVVGLIIICIYLFPIYWMVISSLKDMNEIFASRPTLFPEIIRFEAYSYIFSDSLGFYKYIVNSVVISFFAMLLTILIATPAAYALARKKLRGAGLFILFILLIQMFPPNMMVLPIFAIFSQAKLTDSYIGIILANMTTSMPFIILTLRTFFVVLPKELEDAATVDGCGRWGAFVKIICPISKTGIMTSAAFAFVFAWGEFLYSLTLNSSEKYWPITMGMRQLEGQYGTMWPELMAAATVSSMPVILVFLLLQKYIVSGVTAGAVKG